MRHIKVTFEAPGRQAHAFLVSPTLGQQVEALIKKSMANPAKDLGVPASKILPELADSTLRPATLLKAARLKARLTQMQLAEKLNIRQHHLSEMENAKRPIGKALAKQLAEAFKCDYRLFL